MRPDRFIAEILEPLGFVPQTESSYTKQIPCADGIYRDARYGVLKDGTIVEFEFDEIPRWNETIDAELWAMDQEKLNALVKKQPDTRRIYRQMRLTELIAGKIALARSVKCIETTGEVKLLTDGK